MKPDSKSFIVNPLFLGNFLESKAFHRELDLPLAINLPHEESGN
jgi:hypothetical protein